MNYNCTDIYIIEMLIKVENVVSHDIVLYMILQYKSVFFERLSSNPAFIFGSYLVFLLNYFLLHRRKSFVS
jgi:hypothetical protein